MADADQVDQEAVVKEARTMGWVPKEEFRGGEDKWIDADAFIERGRQILPIVQANNKRLSGEVSVLGDQVNTLAGSLRAAQATIEALEKSNEEDVKVQVEAARADLKKQLAEASRDGNHEAVANITSKMTELNTAEVVADDKDKKVPVERQGPRLHPEVVSWFKDHQDFAKNQRKISLGNVIAGEMRQNGDTRVGTAFMDDVAAEVEKALGGGTPDRTDASRVEGGGRGGSSQRTNGKSYSDLPAEAKQACDNMSKRLVGPNRAHKDIASWRSSYTKQYFGDQS